MQPMYTKKMNQQIAEEIGTIKQYTRDDPKPPRTNVLLSKCSQVTKVLKDQKKFVVPWTPAINNLFPGEKDFSGFMLGGDKAENIAQRNLVGDIMYEVQVFKKHFSDFISNVGSTFLNTEAFEAFQMNSKGLTQIDIIREDVFTMG